MKYCKKLFALLAAALLCMALTLPAGAAAPLVRDECGVFDADTLADIPGTVPPLTAIPCGCRFAPRCARADEHCRAQEPPLFGVNACDRSKCWLVEKGECHGC